MKENQEQTTVDGYNEHMLSKSTPAEQMESAYDVTSSRGELFVRSAANNNLCKVHRGFRAFSFGLYLGISLATMLSLIVLYIELNQVKAELDVVQRQLGHSRRSGQRDQVDHSDVTTETNSWLRSDEASTHTSDKYSRRNNHRIKRDAAHRRNSATGVGRGSGVTLEQVRQLIQNSLSLLNQPSAHLAYYSPAQHSSSSSLNSSSGNYHEEHVFYWDEHHRSKLTHNNLFTYRDDNSRLVIRTSGTFFIYVQVMYNGRRTSNQAFCSHEVKLKPRGSSHTPTLLHSSTTQYNLGRPIYVQYDGSFVRAFDSSFSAGVFHLESGDELRIELDDFSRNCRVIPHVDRSFFGAFRLHAPSAVYAHDFNDST